MIGRNVPFHPLVKNDIFLQDDQVLNDKNKYLSMLAGNRANVNSFDSSISSKKDNKLLDETDSANSPLFVFHSKRPCPWKLDLWPILLPWTIVLSATVPLTFLTGNGDSLYCQIFSKALRLLVSDKDICSILRLVNALIEGKLMKIVEKFAQVPTEPQFPNSQSDFDKNDVSSVADAVESTSDAIINSSFVSIDFVIQGVLLSILQCPDPMPPKQTDFICRGESYKAFPVTSICLFGAGVKFHMTLEGNMAIEFGVGELVMIDDRTVS